MRRRRFGIVPLIALLFLVTLSSVAALKITCADDGSFTIEKSSKKLPVFAESRSKELVKVEGEWVKASNSKIKLLQKFNFHADEGTFIGAAGKHKIKFGEKSYTVSCPAFRFSCRLFNVSMDYCYTINGTFHAKYAVYNFNLDEKKTLRFDKPFVFRYDLVLPDRKRLTHAPDIMSREFAELNITMRKLANMNKFVMVSSVAQEKIDSLEMRYEKCNQRKFNLYERKECVTQPACTIDKDCSGDESCQNNFCQKLICSNCQYALENACVSYECCEHEACAANASCRDNVCQPLQCLENQAPEEHFCVDLACTEDEVAEGHRCVKLACADDEAPLNHVCGKLQCADDEFIKAHQCIKLDCPVLQMAMEHECRGMVQWVKRKIGS